MTEILLTGVRAENRHTEDRHTEDRHTEDTSEVAR